MRESEEKAALIKEALSVIDKIGGLDIEDKDDLVIIEELIEKAKKLKRNRFWRLK